MARSSRNVLLFVVAFSASCDSEPIDYSLTAGHQYEPAELPDALGRVRQTLQQSGFPLASLARQRHTQDVIDHNSQTHVTTKDLPFSADGVGAILTAAEQMGGPVFIANFQRPSETYDDRGIIVSFGEPNANEAGPDRYLIFVDSKELQTGQNVYMELTLRYQSNRSDILPGATQGSMLTWDMTTRR